MEETRNSQNVNNLGSNMILQIHKFVLTVVAELYLIKTFIYLKSEVW